MRNLLSWRPDLGHLILFVIVFGGAVVRFVGLDFGLPLTIKSDEPIVVGGAMEMLERRSFEPDRFQWPNHLGIMATYLAYVFVTPLWHGMAAEQAITDVDLGYFHLIARGVTASFGVISVVLAYFIGRRFSRSVGLLSAALLAFLPPYVDESHYATPDIILTTTVLSVVLAGMLYYEKPGRGRLIVSAVLAALAIMAKYPGAMTTLIIATVVIAAAIRDRAWWRILGHGLLSLVTLPVALFLFSPTLFTNRHQVIRSLGFESRDIHLGADGLTFTEKLDFYYGYVSSSMGGWLLILALVGLGYVVWKRQVIALPLLIGAVFWVALSTLGLQWTRWSLPMFITPLFFSAIGTVALVRGVRSDALVRGLSRLGDSPVWGFLRRVVDSRGPQVAIVGVVSWLLLGQVLGSVANAAGFLRPDTRLIALEDLSKQGITPDNTASEGYSPFVPGGFGVVFEDFVVEGERVSPVDPVISYLVLSDSMYGRFQEDDNYPDEQEFYRLVDANFPLIAEYRPEAPEVPLPLGDLRPVAALRSILETAQGATGGPVLLVYEVAGASEADSPSE